MSRAGMSSGQLPYRGTGVAGASDSTFRTLGRKCTLALLAFLLGHATIAHVVSPFGLAYFVILHYLLGSRKSWPAYVTVLGVYWQGGTASAGVFIGQIVLYLLLRHAAFHKRNPDIHWVPFLAGITDIASRLALSGPYFTRYDIFVSLTDGALVTVLALIFVQCVPSLIGRSVNKGIRQDQLISLTIFLSSVMMGISGFDVGGISLVQVVTDFIVLTMAASGGAGVGTTVAIIVGVLAMLDHSQSLPSVAILGFAALLAGLLKDAGRLWRGLAFVASVAVLTVGTSGDLASIQQALFTSGSALFLYLFSPKRLRDELASYVPGTDAYQVSEQERVRKVRTLLSDKILEMSQVFDELSAAFVDTVDTPGSAAQQMVNQIVNSVAGDVCSNCPLYSKCWDGDAYATYQAISHSAAKIESTFPLDPSLSNDLRERCIRPARMLKSLTRNVGLTQRDAKWIAKLREQKSLVAAQLAGVAKVIKTLALEIDKGTESSASGEEQILSALEQLGLYVDHVHIVSLDPGKVEVQIAQPSRGAYENSVRVIAPLLSGIVGENIAVTNVQSQDLGPCTSVFGSAHVFDVKTAVATVARDGRAVSGDTHTAADLGNGQYAVALSDGMGNGERARRESKAAIELLKKLLKAGFDEDLAIKTVNSTLLLRSHEEMFTTLDMVLIDLFSAKAEFLKIGSAPSFIKRGKGVYQITGANVPIGILQDIEVQSIEEQLYEGDILIVLSDGICDASRQISTDDEWVKQLIARLDTTDPQAIADTLIEGAVRSSNGQINDDMTVMVAAISRHQPEWATIKVPGVTGLRGTKHKKRGA